MHLASTQNLTIHPVAERPLRGEDPSPRFIVFFDELGSAFTHYDWEEDRWPKFADREIKRWARLPDGRA